MALSRTIGSVVVRGGSGGGGGDVLSGIVVARQWVNVHTRWLASSSSMLDETTATGASTSSSSSSSLLSQRKQQEQQHSSEESSDALMRKYGVRSLGWAPSSKEMKTISSSSFMTAELGLSPRSVKKLHEMRPVCSRAIASSDTTRKRALALVEVLSGRFGMTEQELVKFLAYSPVKLDFKTDINVFIEYFTNELGFDDNDLKTIMRKFPLLFRCDHESQVLPVVDFLRGELLMDDADVKRATRKYPQILTLRVDRKLSPMMSYFLDVLGMRLPNLRTAVVRFPQILSHSEESIHERLGLLRDLGMSDADLGVVVAKAPQVLGLVLDKRMEFWKSVVADLLRREALREKASSSKSSLSSSLSLSSSSSLAHVDIDARVNAALAGMIRLCPTILHMRQETVETKLQYAIETMHFSPENILSFPQYFTYSFGKRIKPRFGILKAMNVEDMPLPYMLTKADDGFEQSVARRAAKREAAALLL